MRTDSIRLMAEGIRPLASREQVMRAFAGEDYEALGRHYYCLLYTSPSPRDRTRSRMPSSA